ncbi:dTDP-4-dehydrorhamnose reductase [Amycolatopsis vastitatis]|uniref:dTDP-4-dehydrorhamnose reductase n=1 Tax=Amycolatopsis vastitatis TaxID=1905142 RepID=A0A229SLJ0_9PSEU|nr:dTDP-4-dehydrorhamnose reductase [Amycolatopsis vastitatis]OXM59614.1 dTDP-4-dehydrorhamnose reductase [Amycolatopsis vastitatis]
MRPVLLVPGGTGQLGRELVALAPPGTGVRAPGHAELDLTDGGAVAAAVAGFAADARAEGRCPIVVNAAAYTAVDAAETDAAAAFAVNARGPALLAAACAAHDVPLLHVSTDAVFAGDASRPYEVDDPAGPASVYGRSKLAGERAVLESAAAAWVIRTSWVYGAHGENFVRAMLRLAAGDAELSVVDDQCAAPTWSADLAAGLLELAARVAGGTPPRGVVLHCTGGGGTSRFALARAVFEELGADPRRVRPCTTAEFPRPAPRPAYSVLSRASWRAAGLTPPRHWRRALSAAVPAIASGEAADRRAMGSKPTSASRGNRGRSEAANAYSKKTLPSPADSV